MEDKNWIYPQYNRMFEKQLKKLAEEPTSDHNKELIRRFQDHLFTTGTKQARVAKVTWAMRKIVLLLEKDLDQAVKVDMERVVAAIQRDPKYQDTTKTDYKRSLKHFYKWFEDEDLRLKSKDEAIEEEAKKLYQYLKKHVNTTCPLKELDPGSIVTDEEIQTVLLKGCKYEYERAFIKLIHELGCRIGEILRLRIKDIQQKETHWLIRVDGKTGERTVPIRESIPYVAQWLNVHPDKDNPDAWLWLSLQGKHEHKPLRYVGIRKLINRCFERAGVKKRCNPHWFRHSRATIDAPNYTEPILCKLRGWHLGSRQIRRYTHLSGKDAEDAFLKVKGITLTEKPYENKLQKCICGFLNTAEAKFCTQCGKALSIEVAVQEDAYMKKALEIAGLLLSDPAMREKFEMYKQKT